MSLQSHLSTSLTMPKCTYSSTACVVHARGESTSQLPSGTSVASTEGRLLFFSNSTCSSMPSSKGQLMPWRRCSSTSPSACSSSSQTLRYWSLCGSPDTNPCDTPMREAPRFTRATTAFMSTRCSLRRVCSDAQQPLRFESASSSQPSAHSAARRAALARAAARSL